MLYKIIKIHSETYIEEIFRDGFWYHADFYDVDMDYQYNGEIKRKIFRFKTSTWNFNKKYGKFLV